MGRSDDIAYTYGDTVDANCDFEVERFDHVNAYEHVADLAS
jgi:hypothetical protein